MSITLATSQKAIDQLFQQAAKILYDCIKCNLSYLGETCVAKVRDRSGFESWYDQTGNLRSSVGYAIFSHGQKEIQSAFSSVLGGKEGSRKGREMIAELASQYSETFALVVIAAMDYAQFVEAIEGKDVLASTENYAKQEVDRYLRKAIKEAEKKIQALEVRL